MNFSLVVFLLAFVTTCIGQYDTEVFCDTSYECDGTTQTFFNFEDGYLECSASYSCQSATVNASDARLLYFHSDGERSGEYLTLYSPNNYVNGIDSGLNSGSSNFTAVCSGTYSCRATTWWITGADYGYTTCYGIWACHQLDIYIEDVTDFTWRCSGNQGCRYAEMITYNVTRVYVDIATQEGGFGMRYEFHDACYLKFFYDVSGAECGSSYTFNKIDVIYGNDTLWSCICTQSTYNCFNWTLCWNT